MSKNIEIPSDSSRPNSPEQPEPTAVHAPEASDHLGRLAARIIAETLRNELDGEDEKAGIPR